MSLLTGAARRLADTLGHDSAIIRALRPAYETLLDWSTGGRGIPWTINGVPCRIDPRFRHRMGSMYEPDMAAWLAKHVRPGDVCLDVGANVGVYVLQLAHWSGPNGKVIAVEPNPGARTVLEKHVKLNGLTERVAIVPAAVGDAPGSATLFATGAAGMSRLGAPNAALEDTASPLAVPVVTLDLLCTSHRISPDWLLIDIEGYEIAALRGARELISRSDKPLGIVVEMHPDVWEESGTGYLEAHQLLRELELEPEPLEGQRSPLSEHGHVWLRKR